MPYHYYFKHNSIDFLESTILHTSGMKQSPLNLSHEEEAKNICIYASTCSGRSFFDSLKYIFLSMCKPYCLIYTDLMGIPNLHVQSCQKILTSNNLNIEPVINQAIATMMNSQGSSSSAAANSANNSFVDNENDDNNNDDKKKATIKALKEPLKRKEVAIEFILHELKLNFAQMIDKMIETKVNNLLPPLQTTPSKIQPN